MSAEHCRIERYADILDRSAGSLQTPRLLFRSGIGPKDMITLVQGNTDAAPNLPDEADWIDLPVGENVSDNPSVNVSCPLLFLCPFMFIDCSCLARIYPP